MATLRLFASAREAAGTDRVELPGPTVDAVLDEARRRFGDHFSQILDHAKVWVNGEEAPPGTVVGDGDEVAVLPPVSGGA